MKVLVACEESQEVCKAFRARGHEAYSCDIQECTGGHPEWHIIGDVLLILNGGKERDEDGYYHDNAFQTQDGEWHELPYKWDLIIAHPPCTYMTTASACRMYHKQKDGKSYIDEDRVKKMILSRDLFMAFLNADCEMIAIENPTPMKIACLPKHTEVIQPFEYGHPYTKRTLLWLKGLEPLKPTNIVEPVNGSWVAGDSGIYKKVKLGKASYPVGFRDSKKRSKTFPGIAKAMAEQWGGNLNAECDNEKKSVGILRQCD